MMRLCALAAFLLAGSALAQSKTAPRGASAALGLSQAAPTANPNLTMLSTQPWTSSGVPGALHLVGCTGYRVTLCAITGTIAATGTLQVYYWSDYFGKAVTASFTPVTWPRNKGLDETVPSTVATDCAGSTCQCVTFPDKLTSGLNGGWIYAAPASVTTTGGSSSTVRVLIEAVCSQ